MPLSGLGEVREFYDNTADNYSRIMDAEIELPLYAEVLGELVRLTSSIEGPVLDTSCGSGHMLAKLAREYAPGGELLGVDLSPRMVSIARARLGSSASVYQGDMARLPSEIAEGACAAVISFFSIHHIAPNNLTQCVAEWSRVSTPGGRLLLAAWEGEGPIDYGGQSEIVTQRYREDELVAAVQAAGFGIDMRSVSAVEGIDMDAVYLGAKKLS